jgi:rRNA-processing protein EBP2
VDDDIARETVFHRRALAAVLAAGAHLVAAGIPVRRPDDYYAEMVKNDAHMRKVKDKLFFEQRELEAKAERRRDRDNKQYGKQVQVEKLKERKAQQKADMGLLQRMKKRGAGASATDIMPEEPDWGAPDLGVSRQRAARGGGRGGGRSDGRSDGRGGGRSDGRSDGRGGGRSDGRGAGGRAAGGKREHRESKFGFGGRKKVRTRAPLCDGGGTVGAWRAANAP